MAFSQLSQLIPTSTWIRLLFVMFLLLVLYLTSLSVFPCTDDACFGNAPSLSAADIAWSTRTTSGRWLSRIG